MHNGQNTYLAEYGKIWFPPKKKKEGERREMGEERVIEGDFIL